MASEKLVQDLYHVPVSGRLAALSSDFASSAALKAALLDPAIWHESLSRYARATGLAVALTDAQGALLGECLNPQLTWRRFQSKLDAGPFSCQGECPFSLTSHQSCTCIADALTSGRTVMTRDCIGLVHFAVPLVLNGQPLGTVLAGQVFDRYPEHMVLHHAARQLGLSPVEIWQQARLECPLKQDTLRVYADLLENLSQTFLQTRFHAIQEAERLDHLQRLQETSTRLISKGQIDALLDELLSAAIAMTHADMGNLQLFDSETGKLRLQTWRGVDQEFLDLFDQAQAHTRLACRPALRARRVVVPDIAASEIVANDTACAEIFRQIGIRALQSTPLISRAGRVLGVISSHWRRPHQPSEVALHALDVLARQAADLIERTQAEQALRESEARFELLANAAPVLIWVNGSEGCEFVNRPYLDFFGLSGETEVRGYDWTQYIHPEDRQTHVESYLTAKAARAPFVAQCRLRRADGVYRWFQSLGTPRFLPDGTWLGYVGCSFDVTERHEAEALLEQRVAERTSALERAHDNLRRGMTERQQMQEALFQQEKLAALGTLLANVAHELNNPLAVAAMQLDNLQEEGGSGARTEEIDILRQALERCQSVVQSFLSLARQQAPTRQAVALHKVVDEVLVLLGRTLEADGIDVERHVAEDLPPLWADPSQIHHVVANLITNAHHALRESSPPRHLRLAAAVTAKRRQVRLEVTDNGPGMPQDMQRRVFEPFFTTKPQGVGSGLGLPLCRNIVENHGGTLHLASQPGHGTTIAITLPAAASEIQVLDTPLKPAESRERRHGTILLIDDEAAIAKSLTRLLQRTGHEITTAVNGYEGLAALKMRAYDVILCDMRMPELNGPGFYRELERHYPHLTSRVIFLTGDVLTPETQTFFAQADRRRLVKPFRAAEVRRVIQQVLEEAPPSC